MCGQRQEAALETVTLTIKRVGEVTGLGRTSIYKAISDRKLDTIKFGRRTLVTADSVRKLVEAA